MAHMQTAVPFHVPSSFHILLHDLDHGGRKGGDHLGPYNIP